MALTFLTAETAKALVQDALPTIKGIGKKATTEIPSELEAILSGLTDGQVAPFAVVPKDEKNYNGLVAFVASMNRVASRNSRKVSFAIRSGLDGENKIATGYCCAFEQVKHERKA